MYILCMWNQNTVQNNKSVPPNNIYMYTKQAASDNNGYFNWDISVFAPVLIMVMDISFKLIC